MNLTCELLELCQQLQQEHQYVQSEKEQLQRLYKQQTVLSEKLFHTAWIVRQQKLNLQKFIDQGNTVETSEVFEVNNALEEMQFLDSFKVFSYHDVKYGELLKFLYEKPQILAMAITEGEKIGGLNVPRVIGLSVCSVFGNCVFKQDERSVVCLLKSILESQIIGTDNPRRMLRRPNTAFNLIYKHLCESLFSARLFLTAALHDPIMRLLMEDEWFFDIDPDKAMVRFPAAEKLRRFGEPGTDDYKQKLEQYRSFIVGKLVYLAVRFINSIKANIQCFPASLGWLVSQVYRVLTERGEATMQEIRASCADLVFALFICPAICDPEPHGITSDIPISHIARHNLMQMGQILQVLAISQWEEIDPKVRDLYSRFEKGCMSTVLDLFIEGPWEDVTERERDSPLDAETIATRSAMLLTSKDVREMIGFLRSVSSNMDDKIPEKKQLEQLLSSLPADTPPTRSTSSGVLAPSSASSGSLSATPEAPSTPSSIKKPIFKQKGTRKKASNVSPQHVEEALSEAGEGDFHKSTPTEVLILSIYPPTECPGMITEDKVLSKLQNSQHKSTAAPSSLATDKSGTPSASPSVTVHTEVQEKRTRFSLSHDQESIGNASDVQEVISEAASSHSVEDENELEADNFSDMISANVSGRGSPSISGRDTPLSQAGSVEENPAGPPPQLPVPVPETVRKENRVDVTERFGKFEIKAELAMERDECKSTVSDTWSTDVLASDSEPPEQNQVDRLEEVAEEIVRPFLTGSEPISEMSETASDAWSTDVLASDTDEKHSELLKDLEQDLLGGIIDRDEGDNSIGQEEGEENNEFEQIGAVGGAAAGPDSNDSFPDVFTDSPESRVTDEHDRKRPGIVHNFHTGPNLQLPSSHRLQKLGDNRISSSLSQELGQGARSKTRVDRSDVRRRERDVRRGSGTDDNSELDPLSSSGGSSGVRHWKEKRIKHRNIDAERGVKSHEIPREFSPIVSSSSSDSSQQRSASRDSGIDIWVNSNGQMSGNTVRVNGLGARASLDSNTDTVNQRQIPTLPGRASLDSNMQRLHSMRGVMTSTPDSGLHSSYMSTPVNSSVETNTPPIEMENPLFNLQTATPDGSTQIGESILLLEAKESEKDQNEKTVLRPKLHRTTGTPHPATDISKKISLIEGDGDESDSEVINTSEQQLNTTLNERRLSSAMTLEFDPFAEENENEDNNSSLLSQGDEKLPINPEIKDLHISFADPIEVKTLPVSHTTISTPPTTTVTLAETETDLLAKEESVIDNAKAVTSGLKGEFDTPASHRRHDSSGSNQSSSSFRLNVSGEARKDTSADNLSQISDDKEISEGEESTASQKSKKGGFLSSMRDKVFFSKGIKKKKTKFERDASIDENETSVQGISFSLKRSSSRDPPSVSVSPSLPTTSTPVAASTSNHSQSMPMSESTDDILAKYRTPKKTSVKSSNNNHSNTPNNNSSTPADKTDTDMGPTHQNVSSTSPTRLHSNSEVHDESGTPFLDPDNLETCDAFVDAKRKLRIALSIGDIFLGLNPVQSSSPREGPSWRESEINTFLGAQLAEAINLQNKDLVAQLYEVIRCIKVFDSDGSKRLIQSMKEDYHARSAYISYLVRARQGLLVSRAHIQRLLNRVNRDKEICNKHLTTICARTFLEKRERRMWKFLAEFQKLTVSDEKIDLVEQFLQRLYDDLLQEPLWKKASEKQVEEGNQAIERFVMMRIYTHAMFPNGDGDILRDQVLQEHMRKLSKVISPSHKDLKIPRAFHLECPWPAAQKEIYMINAYRTPRDKIHCVLRCSQTIMNLLSMASVKSVPAADDFMPVLIFVLIKANPFGLLSTIQYVNSFYESRMQGEEQYWWLQLTSAVEFIKTMEYS